MPLIKALNAKIDVLIPQNYLESLRSEKELLDAEDTIQKAVELILQAATRMLVFPEVAEKRQLRAFCHLVDTDKKELYPFAFWSPQTAHDSKTRLPYQGPDSEVIVAAEAYTRKIFVAKNLPENHLQKLTPKMRKEIDPNLKYVVAAPILSEDGSEALGTITFDSATDTVEQIGFNTEVAQKITEVFAGSLYHIIKLNEKLREKARLTHA